MKMSKLILANWSNIPNREYDLSDLVFLTGETGVGKSTMLDAIQTLMTASKNGIVKYNAGQDEAQNKKRNKEYRTLQGYFAGEDRFKFSRPTGCRSTIALTFQNSPKEEEACFSALITGSVDFEESKGEKKPKLDSLKFYIIRNTKLVKEDFSNEKGQLLNHTELYKSLCNKYDKDNVIHCTDKLDYLNTLYGTLWGRLKTISSRSTKAAKAFANFIHARPVENINSFVRNEFLASKNMKEEVNSLSNTIRSLDKLKKDAREIEDSIEVLNKLDSKLYALIKKWQVLGEEYFVFCHYDVLKQKNKIIQDEKKYEKLEKQIKKSQRALNKLDEEQKSLDEKLIDLNISKQSNDKVKELESIEFKLEEARKNFNTAFSNSMRLVGKIESISNDVNMVFKNPEQFEELCILLSEFKVLLEEFVNNSFNTYFINSNIDTSDIDYQITNFRLMLEKLEDSYTSLVHSFEFNEQKENLEVEYKKLIVKNNDLDERIATLKSEIKTLEETQYYCPQHIQNSVENLRKFLPKANVHLLYEFIELKDEAWREAIEGYIANNRFAVIVSSQYESQAIEVVKQHDLKLKIIQGKKVLEELSFRGKAVHEDSIINLLEVSDEKALAYLICTYSEVLQVNDSSVLPMIKRGITKDCKAASSNLLFTCKLKDQRFIFGQEAQRRTLMKMKDELELLEKDSDSITSNIDILNKVKRVLSTLKSENKLVNIEDISNISYNHKIYHETKELKALIDTSDYDEIIKQIQECNKRKESIKYETTALNQEVGADTRSLNEKTRVEQTNQKDLEDKIKKLEASRYMFQIIYNKLVVETNIGFENYEKNILDRIDIKKDYSLSENIFESLKNLHHNFDSYFTSQNLLGKVALPKPLTFEELILCEEHFNELLTFRKDLLEKIDVKNNSLTFKYKKDIESADKQFKNIFLNDFCNAIYTNIRQGEGAIDRLNETLRKHKFGNETYKIRRFPADEELKQYEEYFKAIHETKTNLDENSLFEALDKQGFEHISKALLDKFMDNEKHINELIRISDYRNYNNYDIYQEIDGNSISLSRNGKNSGGQGETSYYIIRSINLQSALKPLEAAISSLESIIIDESFLKSNEKRSKEILSYLNESLGFQVICAMPTKNVGTFYEIESTNYHFVHHPGKSNPLSELDYTTYAEFKIRNNSMVKKLFEKEEKDLFEIAKQKAEKVYEQ